MLADVPAGESPAGGNCSIATALIADNGKGDQPAESSGVKSAREASNSAGRNASELGKPRESRPI